LEGTVEENEGKPGITEKKVRRIMVRYFKEKNIKVIAARGPGPDFLYCGKAIEMKGNGAKGAEFNRAISQFIKYVFQYSTLEIALPIEILTADNLIRLDLLSRMVWESLHKKIKAHLITSYKHEYFVKDFDDFRKVLGRALSSEMGQYEISHSKNVPPEDLIERMKYALVSTSGAIWTALHEILLTEADMVLGIYTDDVWTRTSSD
jgi:hypothetical protein